VDEVGGHGNNAQPFFRPFFRQLLPCSLREERMKKFCMHTCDARAGARVYFFVLSSPPF
jgi:hypothetical protein